MGATAASLYKRFLVYGKQAMPNGHIKRIFQHILRARFENCVKRPDEDRIKNTLQLFRAAAETNGLERRCLQTIVHVEQSRYETKDYRKYNMPPHTKTVLEYDNQMYASIIDNVNASMNTCL